MTAPMSDERPVEKARAALPRLTGEAREVVEALLAHIEGLVSGGLDDAEEMAKMHRESMRLRASAAGKLIRMPDLDPNIEEFAEIPLSESLTGARVLLISVADSVEAVPSDVGLGLAEVWSPRDDEVNP